MKNPKKPDEPPENGDPGLADRLRGVIAGDREATGRGLRTRIAPEPIPQVLDQNPRDEPGLLEEEDYLSDLLGARDATTGRPVLVPVADDWSHRHDRDDATPVDPSRMMDDGLTDAYIRDVGLALAVNVEDVISTDIPAEPRQSTPSTAAQRVAYGEGVADPNAETVIHGIREAQPQSLSEDPQADSRDELVDDESTEDSTTVILPPENHRSWSHGITNVRDVRGVWIKRIAIGIALTVVLEWIIYSDWS